MTAYTSLRIAGASVIQAGNVGSAVHVRSAGERYRVTRRAQLFEESLASQKIKPGAQVLLLDAPDGFEETLSPLPPDVAFSRRGRGPFQLVILFAATRDTLVRGFEHSTSLVAPKGHLWIAWPKKTSRLAADLTQDFVRAYGLERLWVDFKICAIDADWSGLCFARR